MPSINANCTKCALHETAKTVCMSGRGAVPCDLLIVGQNPGYKEDRTGEPFVGDSGTLLNRLIRNIDSSISVRITNSVKCYTQDNRKPTPPEQEACRPYLVQEILEARPSAILVLGNEALTSVTGQGGVSKKRNVPLDLRADIRLKLRQEGMVDFPKVLATWHPAFILRDMNHYNELEESITAAVRYIKTLRGEDQGKSVMWDEWGHMHEIDDLVDETNTILGYDIETNGLEFRNPNFKILMLGIANKKRAYVVRRKFQIDFVINYIKAKGIPLVGYNSISFDDVATGLESTDCLYLDYLVDEGVSSYNGRNQKGRHKLQSSVVRHLQIPPWKDEVVWDWAKFDVFSNMWDTAARYNARDAVYTVKNYAVLYEKLTDKQKKLLKYIMEPAGRLLAKMEQRGVPISLKNLEEAALEIGVDKEKALDILMRKAFEYDLWTFNPNSHPQVRELLFSKMKLKPVTFTAGAEPSTDETTLRTLLLTNADDSSVLKTLEALRSYRENKKLESTYIEKCVPEADGRIHAGYSLTQTTTGRTASYGWSPQRTPRDKRLRRVVAAPEGYKLISADLSQIEMRTMAFLSREPNMLAVYRDGQYGGDMHNFMSIAMVKEMYGRETYTEEDRSLAKRVNFGCLYGAEWFTLQATMLADFGVKLSKDQCIFLRDSVFFKSLPGLPEYYDKVIRALQRTGVVEGTFGLRRQLPNIASKDTSLKVAAAREAINTDNQGLASYLALIGCFLLEESAGYLVEQIAFNHDATLCLVKEDEVEDAIAHIKEAFEVGIRNYVGEFLDVDFDVPIKIDVKVGDTW